MTKEPNLETVNRALGIEVRKLQEELKAADKEMLRLRADGCRTEEGMSETPINDLILPDPAGYNLAMADTIDRLTARVAELEESIEDAHQAASETQPSWKHRCYAIMAALGVDYGDPDWMMPDEHKALTARVKELEAALEWYADSAHYRTRVDPYGDGRNYPAMVQLDYGEKARAALTPEKEKIDPSLIDAYLTWKDDQ